MQKPDVTPSLPEARAELNDWLQAAGGQQHDDNASLAAAFCAVAKERFQLDLLTNWNPSACTFDARWQHQGRAAEGIEKPFPAEAQEEARILACAGLLRLIRELEK